MNSNEAFVEDNNKFDFRHEEFGMLAQHFGENVNKISGSYICTCCKLKL